MSLKLMTWVFHESTSKGIDKLVLLAIADHAHDDGVSAYPGMTLLAKKAGVGKGTICRAIERLAELGELEVTDRQTTAKAGAKIGRGAKLAYRIITTGNVPERNDKKVPERNDRRSEGSADAHKKVPLTSSPIEEEPSLSMNRKIKSVPPTAADAKKAAEPRPDVDELCRLLAARIVANGASEARYRDRPATKAWRDPMRRLIDLDKVSPDRVRKAIDWCQTDEFWKAVILSPANLRENYDKLRLAAQRPTNGNGNGYRNGQPERRGPTIPEADLSQLPPTDPDKLAAWYDRQLEGIPT